MTEPAEFLEQLRAALPVRAASATVSVTDPDELITIAWTEPSTAAVGSTVRSHPIRSAAPSWNGVSRLRSPR